MRRLRRWSFTLAKISSWGGYLPLALADPEGIETATSLHRGEIVAPQHLIDKQIISYVGVVLIVAALCYAVREARLANPPMRTSPVIVPITLLAAVWGVLMAGWGL